MVPEEQGTPFEGMEIEYVPDLPGLWLRGSGTLTPAWAFASMGAVLAAPEFEPGMSVLLDLTAMDFTDVVARDIGVIVRQERSEVSGERLPGRVAVLVQDDLPYGLSRMFEALSERDDGPAYRVVRSREDAFAWLADA